MDDLTQAYAVLFQNNMATVQEYKVNLPEFPLWWLDKSDRNMDGLREIASYLHTKTAADRISRAGFVGDASEMEKQIIRNVSGLEQQVYALTDVVQSTLQIIAEDHWRRTHRVERFLAWTRETAKTCERKLAENVLYRILAIASTLGLLLGLAKLLAVLGRFLLHVIRGVQLCYKFTVECEPATLARSLVEALPAARPPIFVRGEGDPHGNVF